ncbi:MAG: ORF6N domain-containing protein [Bacteroidales bacterium]|jgi:hypothetical protein|nr:ORF6N domain-containing protein [Bacteroidales bacterium]
MKTSLIRSKIHEIRGQRVMLDFDLAEMYQVETRILNQSVKRNTKRFPDDFAFQLTTEEWSNLKSQFVISRWGGSRKLPYVFTQEGIAMLSGLLNSDIAIEMNIAIMRTFVYVRNMVVNAPTDKISELRQEVNALKEYVEEVFTDYNDINEDTRIQIELINLSLAELQTQKEDNKPLRRIGFRFDKEED